MEEYDNFKKLCRSNNNNFEEISKIPNLSNFIDGIKENGKYRKMSELTFAILNQNYELSDLLFNLGADINFEHEGSEKYSVALIHDIIEAELDTFYVFQCSEYPEVIETKILEYAIKKGVDINKSDGRGYTPLDWCIEYNHYTGAEILVKNGAKHSKYFFKSKIEKIYEDKKNLKGYFKVYPHLENLSIDDCIDTVKTYKKPKIYPFQYELDRIYRGSQREIIDKNGNSLYLPQGIGFIESLLKDDRADVNEKDDKGRTPLDYAIELGNTVAEKFLRENGGKLSSEL
ncbi:MAG: ankyrin repeat domain-containing protein [Candidatus Sericytochromatia bacterium]